MKGNNHDATPNRFDSCRSSVLQTPLNSELKPLFSSPFFHAVTPDLSTPCIQRTPALQLSLGIEEDLNMSWESSMATPSKPQESSLTTGQIIDEDDQQEGSEKGKAIKMECDSHVRQELELPEDLDSGTTSASVSDFVLHLLKKPRMKFIYPEPVPVKGRGMPPILCQPKAVSVVRVFKPEAFSGNDAPLSSPVISQSHRKNPKEIRKSLKFSDKFQTDNHSSDSSLNGSPESTDNRLPSIQTAANPLKNTSLFDTVDEAVQPPIETTRMDKVPPPSVAGCGFNTAGGKSIAISKEAMERYQKVFEEIDGETPTSNITVPAPCGFSTAAGKKVNVSKEVVARYQKMFDDIDTEPPSNLPVAASSGFKPVSGIKPNVLKENPVRSTTTTKPALPLEPSCGFSTAAGKKVSVSKEAIERYQKMFEEIDDVKAAPPATAPKTAGCGFSTAGGKNLNVSNEVMARYQKIYEEMEVESTPNPSSSGPASEGAKSLSSASSKSTPPRTNSESTDNRKLKVDDDDDIPSSPTIGMKKRRVKKPKAPPQTPATQSIMNTPSFIDTPTYVSVSVLTKRRVARHKQKSIIESKKVASALKVTPKPGRLYLSKCDKSLPKETLRELVGDSYLPEQCQPGRLMAEYGMTSCVCLVTADNAASFQFYAWECFPGEDCSRNSNGFQLGDFMVILSDDNTVGFEEIADSLLSLESVDPKLVSIEWIRNHYRWIVWKLSSMELRLPAVFARKALTPINVLEQLKYRYDVEVDRCQRSTLKRIIEQDDTPVKTMVLCVVKVKSPEIIELTDGWYCIDAHCVDTAFQQLVRESKIFIGLKLIISGAELASPGPATPLDKGFDTFLKISSNSTRRARWDAKLGVLANPMPFPISLSSILPDGGIISHLRVTISRVYPLVYMMKTPDGKKLFHGERYYRRISEGASVRYERLLEKMIEDIERQEDEQERKRVRIEGKIQQHRSNLTDEEKRNWILAEATKRMQGISDTKASEGMALLRLRIVDWSAKDPAKDLTAIVSVWRPTEDTQQHLRENKSYHLYKVTGGGLRLGELQLNSGNQTMWKEMKNTNDMERGFERTVTSYDAVRQTGFKPLYNELDVVGFVVYVEQQLDKKGPFQTVVLSDGTNYFGVKCWGNLEDYALADVIVVGAFLAFANLQWRTTASRQTSNLPFGFIHEGTWISSRPALKHLDVALNELKQTLDAGSCLAEAETKLSVLLGCNTTPQSVTSRFIGRSGGSFTPTPSSAMTTRSDTPVSTNPQVQRARLLEKYGTPPALAPCGGTPSPLVRRKFKPPAKLAPSV